MKVAGKMDVAYTYPGSGQNNGRISAMVDNVLSETVTYQYDQLNRLTRATSGTSWDLEFVYDSFGNRTEQKILAGTGPSTPILSFYQTNNKISTPGYAHDANGNLTNIAGFSGSTAQTLDYDPANRLNTWKWNNGSPTEYSYDSGNKRIRKCTLCDQPNKDEEFYVYGISGELLGAYELVQTGSTYQFGRRWNNVYFGGRLIYAQDKWVITDRLGSVRWREGAGAIGYYPYGEVRTGSVNNQNGYGTYFRDGSGNLDYADQRYYGSTHARFLTPDPSLSADATEPLSFNLYSYVGNDPINFLDPEGLDRCMDIKVLGSTRTVNDLFDVGTDLGLLATTVFVESAMRRNDEGVEEMAAIASVIINRYNIVNGFAKLVRSNGTFQQAPRAWGSADRTLRSIVVNPSQFQVWQGPGGTLTFPAQERLARGLRSAAESDLCAALLNAIGTADLALDYKDKAVLLVHPATGLAYTGFNSFPETVKYDWEEKIGPHGSANVFYGVPQPIPIPPLGRSMERIPRAATAGSRSR